MIDAVSAATAASATGAPAAASKAVSQDEFLKLFVAQLQNQDPLSPMDPTQLTSQLAQFSSLEQLTGVNTRLDGLTTSAKQQNGSALLGLIGKRITIDGSRLGMKSGQAADVRYTLTQPAAKVTATVRDQGGNTVRVVELGAAGTGPHTFHFDGKSATGATLPDGVYQLEIDATATGAKVALPLDLASDATVDGVDLTGDPPVLLAGSLRIPFDQVREVHSAGTSP